MQLPFSEYNFHVRTSGGKQLIRDIIRRKDVVLTPEEWVRQHLVHFFIYSMGFPKSLISVEKKITLHGLTKRTDIVLYNRNAKPVMLVECKAPEVAITQEVFNQAGRYNLVLRVPYIMVSNGNTTLCAAINYNNNSFTMLEDLPAGNALLES